MATAARLPALKTWQLKYWAFMTGSQTTGTKAELQALLTNRMKESSPLETPSKIVSVDMGIRNLAYCAVEVPRLGEKEAASPLKVTAWKRMDLTTPKSQPHDASSKLKPSSDAFTPPHLSRTALTVTQELLSQNPSAILIERQRFRSGGAAAVQEWTVRVNMLESMIWACLETLRSSNKKIPSTSNPFPSTHAVSPAQVVNFWSAPASNISIPEAFFDAEREAESKLEITNRILQRVKLEKKDKVELVRKWCRGECDQRLEFGEEAAKTAEAFTTASKQTRVARELVGGKLDDVADCLIQGVTWVKWERNRRVLGELWEKAVEAASRAK